MKIIAYRFCLVLLATTLSACTGVPEGIQPVDNFELNSYLGTWYEIARLDYSFERGLEQVTAQYSVRDDGGVKVINRGYSSEQSEWEQAEGKAYFVNDENIGHLKVSFFGPFYGSYIIFKLDKENYQYAYITGYNRDYLWLLTRTPNVDQELKDDFVSTIEKLGFDAEKLIWVIQK